MALSSYAADARFVIEPLDARVLLAGEALDTLIFGSPSSETSHALTSTSTQIIAGALGQPARQALPLNPVAVNGGSLSFTMAVDPVMRNYFSVKLWAGDDSDQGKGRLYLYVDVNGTDYQVGYRHEGDSTPLSVSAARSPLPGRFFYSTTMLPLTGTAGTLGKTSMTLTIQSTGELYGLGSGGPPSGNYQFNMDTASRGIYRAYTHTDARLDVSGETQGTAPTVTTRPAVSESSILSPSGTYTTGLNNWVNARLGAAITSFTTSQVELLARSYSVSQLSSGYQNAAVINKVIAVIDGFTTDWYANPGNVSDSNNYGADGGNEVWGGRFGPLGWAIHLLSSAPTFTSQLDTVVNYGSVGGDKTRRQAWGDMLQASRDVGRINRDSRYLTNQSLLSDINIYKANRGLLDLADSDALTETAAQRYLKESAGVLPWLGSDLPSGGSSNKYGTDYYQITPDGLTREWGYAGGYSEMSAHVATFYKWTGNTAFRDQAVKMIQAIAHLRRPAIETSGASNYRSMERIGLLAWRGVREADGYFTDEITYGNSSTWSAGMIVAGATLDPSAVGYAKQMLADNQYLNNLVADSRYYSSLSFDALYAMEVYDDYNAVKNAPDSGIRLPTTDGQPDFAWVDEQNGIAVIKHGSDKLWVEPFWQAKTGTGINGIARFHYSTATYDQYGVFETNPQFDFSGSVFVRPNLIDYPERNLYVPPDAPTQAYAGEKLPIGNNLDAHDHAPFRGGVDFYGFRFGNYLFGMNQADARSFDLKTPAGFASATDLVSGASMNDPVTVAPNSSVILYLPDTYDPAPVPTAPLLVEAAGTSSQIALSWSVASGAATYNVKRSLTNHGPYVTIASNVAATSFVDTAVVAGNTYYYVVTAANANGESYPSGQVTASAALPAPWLFQDIGPVNLPGSSTYLPDGTFRLAAAGSGVGGTSDSFHFAYIPVTGNATIIARVGKMGLGGVSIAGVMMRESLDPGSRLAAIHFEDSGNLRLLRRTSTGGTAATSGSLNSSYWAPGWIKLQRTNVGGSNYRFDAYYSADGVTWGSPFSTQTFSMNHTIYVGVDAASRTSVLSPAYDQTLVAHFTNVGVFPAQQTVAAYPYETSGTTLTFGFTGDVSASLAISDLQLTHLGGGAVPAVQSVTWNVATNTATFTLAAVPADGNYTATLPAASITDALGNPLASPFTLSFYTLAGDANRDRSVDIADLAILATNWQKSPRPFSQGDFNYDGSVDIADLAILATNWQQGVPAPIIATPASSVRASAFSAQHSAFTVRPASARRSTRAIDLVNNPEA